MSELKVYSLEEVAKILQISRRTLYTYVKEGKLKAVKVGKYWRVKAEYLEDFLSKGTTVADGNRRKENQS